jgi:hypothetical protein
VLIGFEWLPIIAALSSVAVLVLVAVVVQDNSRRYVPPPLSTPSGQPGETTGPATFSYFEIPTHDYQDIDVRIANNGFVRQVFTARSSIVRSIVVIASRQPSPTATFSPDAIGRVRLQIAKLDPGNPALLERYIPITLADSGQTASAAGVVIEAGPNHQNTTFHLDPVRLMVGARYAFTVTNLSGDWMAFSLHPSGVPGEPLFMYGYQLDPRRVELRTDRALTGYVCSINNCS